MQMKPNYSYNAIIMADTYEEAKVLSKKFIANGKFGAWCKPCLFLSLSPQSASQIDTTDCKYVIGSKSMTPNIKQAVEYGDEHNLSFWRVKCFECRDKYDKRWGI